MASEVATIQSLKAVDAWIDVINSNINGGVRTAYKTSRLKFSGSNTEVSRAGNTTNLPLQFPEPSLTTSNTVIDFTQGAITSSTENTHLAVQGTGFFMVVDPTSAATASTGMCTLTASSRILITRDGEFRTNQNGFLVNSNGYYVVTASMSSGNPPGPLAGDMRLVYNNMDNTALSGATGANAVRLTDFISNSAIPAALSANGAAYTTAFVGVGQAIVKVPLGQQSLKYSQYGSTVFDFGYSFTAPVAGPISMSTATTTDASILSKSLEASNASMTQSVPELSLAQKLFSALTKVIQIHQTNTDAVINLIR
jgi:flagellar hook protein FlgE